MKDRIEEGSSCIKLRIHLRIAQPYHFKRLDQLKGITDCPNIGHKNHESLDGSILCLIKKRRQF